jgi:hypothetical protein
LVVGSFFLIDDIFNGRRRRTAEWESLAQRTHLTIDPERLFHSASLFGRYRGRHVTVERWVTPHPRDNDDAIFWIQAACTLNKVRDYTFTIGTPNIMSYLGGGVAKHFQGMTSINNGEFADEQYLIGKSSQPQLMLALLGGNDMIRQGLAGLDATFFVEFDGRRLRYCEVGTEKNADRLKITLDLLSDLADDMERA